MSDSPSPEAVREPQSGWFTQYRHTDSAGCARWTRLTRPEFEALKSAFERFEPVQLPRWPADLRWLVDFWRREDDIFTVRSFATESSPTSSPATSSPDGSNKTSPGIPVQKNIDQMTLDDYRRGINAMWKQYSIPITP